MPGRSWRAVKASGDGKLVGPDRPLEKGVGGFNKSSSDDRPGICDSKYVEDAKAARSVRVWDRVPIKQQDALRKRKMRFSFSLGFHYISRLAAANIGCASEEEKEFSSSLGFHYICKLARMYGAYGMVIDDDDTDKKTENA